MLIWGIRRTARALGQIGYACSCCRKQTFHTAVAQKTWFTLFFIPVIPLGKKYAVCCNICGQRSNAGGVLERQLGDWEQTGQLRDAAAFPA